jgi:hypothetical protein
VGEAGRGEVTTTIGPTLPPEDSHQLTAVHAGVTNVLPPYTPVTPAGPDPSLLAGTWTLAPQISIDCGGAGDLGFRLTASEVTIAHVSPEEGAVRLTFASADEYAMGTVSNMGGGSFESLVTFVRSKVRLRFSGNWTPGSSDEISAKFRFEFEGSTLDTGPLGVPQALFPNPCRDTELPANMRRQ